MLILMQMKRTKFHICVCLFAVFLTACGANDGDLKDGKVNWTATNATPAKPIVERDIDDMRTAGFQLIYVLRRKDGKVFDADDRSFIKAKTDDANRRVSSDDDKAFVIGSNRPAVPANWLAIFERFAVEDYSPPPPPTDVNTNTSK